MMQLPIGAYQTKVTECPVCGKELASAKGLGSHVRAKHPDIHTTTERIRNDFNAAPADVLNALHNIGGLTVQQISQRFGYHRDQIAESFELLGVERDRRAGLTRIWEDYPEQAQEWAKEHASLGTPARNENGMTGVTGQDHPHWRGGKSIYDAVKKQLRPSFATVKDDYRSEECYSCGESDCKLDVHHIIPILSGGTNGEWNMMTLCESCHSQVEWFTRDLVEPVLIE